MNHNIYLAVIEVTNGCNLSCKHCYGEFNGHKTLGEDEFCFIVKKLKTEGLETIHITGGEPLILKDGLLKYLKIANQYGVNDVRLLTNGLMISEMSDSFFDSWSRIQISLDGLKQNHDYIRGNGNFDRAWSGVRKLKTLNKQIDIMFTINSINFDDCKQLYKICKKENLNFSVEIYTRPKSNGLLNIITKTQYKQIIDFCITNNIHCNDPLVNVACKNKRDSLMDKKETVGCLAGIAALVVDVDGNIYPCPRIRTKMGNILTESLDEIINNSCFVQHNIKRDFEGKCGDCKYKYICGGCRALACTLDGSIYSDNKYCFVYEK
jgi:AdoMet-dependent heme synthase